MNYKGDRNYSWNHSSQQSEYLQQQQPQPQQLYSQHQYSNIPHQYPYENLINASGVPINNTAQQMNFSSSNAAPDPWNWGWEDSSNNSPATSFSANNNVSNDPSSNWNINDSLQEQSTFNSVQNYFQHGSNLTEVKPHQEMHYEVVEQFQSTQQNQVPIAINAHQNFYENDEKPGFNLEKNSEVLNIKSEVEAEDLSNLSLENANEANFHGGEGDFNFEVKSEGAQSYRSSSLSNTSGFKTDRLSPNSSKTPLTTQALRDFCKEKYENGPADLKSRSNTEGLTPQWSVESQMSQDTTSDDISPSLHEGSHSDLSMWDSTPGHQQLDSSQESTLNTSSRPSIQNKDSNNSKKASSPQVQSGENFTKNIEGNFTTDEKNNQQVIQSAVPPPPMTMPPRSGDDSGNNPYSLGQKHSKKGSAPNKNVHQKQPGENFSGNEYTNLVKQMENCSVSKDNSNQQVIPESSLANDRKGNNRGFFTTDNQYGKRTEMSEDAVNQETIPDNEERPDAEEHRKTGTENAEKFSKVSYLYYLLPFYNQVCIYFIKSYLLLRIIFYPLQKSSKAAALSRSQNSFPLGSDNQEIAPRPDRNQYLETGQLEDQLESDSAYNDNEMTSESLPPPGLSRHVPGNYNKILI